MKLNPYLNFDGNCEEALHFYADVLGGEIKMMMRFTDAPPGSFKIEDTWKDKIMHATLAFGEDNNILLSDSVHPGFVQGNNAHMSLNVLDEEEAEKVFNNLLEGGNSTMPFGPVFWGGKFGMLTDKFGVQWMVSSEH
ncbi:VOC family protein [Pseudofulvibacter geojedonensis]|uniref:VOC family protein n=1 Tax=Pseudofulvibacter geojedonensis TaxID=1123758 RepID=A0ABW3I432_9FLAO